MNYRRVHIDKSSIKKEISETLYQIAKWHNTTPKIWIPDYRASTTDIDETLQKIQSTKNEDLFLMIAEDEQDKIQGFIWACKQEKPQDSVMILSLYVARDYRRQGIATKLKELLEKWCRQEGIKTIHTTTHYNNHNMIVLNQKLGYVPGMVHMIKTL